MDTRAGPVARQTKYAGLTAADGRRRRLLFRLCQPLRRGRSRPRRDRAGRLRRLARRARPAGRAHALPARSGRADRRAGRVLREDERGLYVEGRLAPGVARAREVHDADEDRRARRAVDRLPRPSGRAATPGPGVRRILEADLWEISVVTFPDAARGARHRRQAPSRRLPDETGTGAPADARGRAGGTRGPGADGQGLRGARRHARRCGTQDDGRPRRSARPPEGSSNVPEDEFDEARTAAGRPKSRRRRRRSATALRRFHEAFEAFKEANDRAHRRDRADGFPADVVTTDKIERINRAMDEQKRVLDELVLKKARPALGRAAARRQPGRTSTRRPSRPISAAATRRGCASWRPRRCPTGAAPMAAISCPTRLDSEIGRGLGAISPIRAIATVRQVSGAVLKKPFAIAGMAAGWVGETDARPQTDDAAARRAALSDDGALRHAGGDRLAARRCGRRYRSLDRERSRHAPLPNRKARPSSPATASTSRRGFLAYPTVDDSGWGWGNIGYVATGVDGAFAGSGPSDTLIDTIYALKAGHRQNATLRDEPQDAGRDPQVQGRRRQLSLAAAGRGRPGGRR